MTKRTIFSLLAAALIGGAAAAQTTPGKTLTFTLLNASDQTRIFYYGDAQNIFISDLKRTAIASGARRTLVCEYTTSCVLAPGGPGPHGEMTVDAGESLIFTTSPVGGNPSLRRE